MKKFMRNCAIIALCLVALGLALTIVTGSYLGKKTIKETVKTVMNEAFDVNEKKVDGLEVSEEVMQNDVVSESGSSKAGGTSNDSSAENTVYDDFFKVDNASEAIAELQSLDEETKAELMEILEDSLDAETMEKVNQAMEGVLGEEELVELFEELNDSLDVEAKLALAGQLAGLFGEEEMAEVVGALENVVDEEAVNGWAEELGNIFNEKFWESVNEAEFDIDDSIVFNQNHEIMSGDVEKYALGSNVNDMNLKVAGASFCVEESKDDNYYVEAKDVSKFQAYVDGECLYIKTLKTSANTIDYSKVTLYVPAGSQLTSVWAELGAGQIVLENVNAKKQDITVGAGQITLDNVQAEELTVEVGMGELVATDMNVDRVNAEVGMGHMLLKGAINEEANIECAMGSVEVECKGTQDDFNYEIDGAMGEVVIGNKQYAGVAQEQKINNNASKNMKLECAMGSLVIDFKN